MEEKAINRERFLLVLNILAQREIRKQMLSQLYVRILGLETGHIKQLLSHSAERLPIRYPE